MSEQPTHVLLIEDNQGDADLVRLRLIEGKRPVDVSCANRLSDGLASLARNVPSVVLLDLNLPDSQGADTFRKVLENAPQVPVVILSGQDDETLAMKALHQGVQDYLIKGDFTSSHLERAMRHAMERQALLRSLEMSRQQQLEFKNQFLSHISHELRTPLTCIHQFANILIDGLAGEVNPEQKDHLSTILKSVNQLSAMVRDLLEAARAESHKIHVVAHCVNIGDLMRQALAMMQATAREKQVGLEIGIDNRIPLVLGDPARILEVLINLIDNGIKFTPADGSVLISASMVDADPEFVYVSVTDTGCGIKPEARALIFERLFQDPEAIDNNRSGLGLGLYIARELVRLHGGRIWVASDPGHGSTFTFTLPLYSLAKLLTPVVVSEGRLRDAIVLVRVELTPKNSPARGNWKDTCARSLEILQRCVYLDKDLVMPPMASSGPSQTYFVVASTDLQRSEIMMHRIREQLEKIAELTENGKLSVTAAAVPLPAQGENLSLPQQVQAASDAVTSMALSTMGHKHSSAPKQSQDSC